MAYKKLGPDVSEPPSNAVAGAGQYTADDHSFESVVFQQDRPLLDWEFNLLQEVLGQAGTRLMALRSIPAGVLGGDFLEAPDLSGSYSFLSAVTANANRFGMRAQDFVINGWPVRFEYSGSATPGMNVIELPAPPAGGNRTDLVILEVWRALVSAAPSTLNKSPTGQILRHGNAKAADQFPPGNVNLADDILDPDYNQESQARIQVQYRYRVISGVNLGSSDIDGFGTLLARSVPYQNASGVDGEAPISPLAYSPSPQSYGLWVAGNANAASAAALGSVDGLMYAVPLCAVFRRNSSAFSETNKNGAPLIASGSSNRPDGLYADQIVEGDVKDLRHGQMTDLQDVLAKNFQYLLDNTLATEHESFTDELSTVEGTSFLVGDLIGATSQHAGDADGCRLSFSDRPVTEAVVAKVTVSSVSSVSFSLNALTLPWKGSPVNVKLTAPSGTFISQVTKVRLVTGSSDLDLMNPTGTYVTSTVIDASPGPEYDRVTLGFSAAVTGTLYVEFLLTYPSGKGVQRNVLEAEALWTPNPSGMQTGTDSAAFTQVASIPARYSLNSSFWSLGVQHRELRLKVPITSQTASYFVAADGKVYVPERLQAVPTIAGQTVTMTQDTAYTALTLTPGASAGTSVSVTYKPYRAAEPHASGYRIWYRSRAVQSLNPPAGTQTLKLVPRAASSHAHVILSGSGSPDSSYPFDAPGVQIPIPTQPAANYPEARASSPNAVSVIGYGTNTGYAALPVLLPYVPNPKSVTLYRDALDGVLDGDNRRFWPKSDDGSQPVYSPTVHAANLAQPCRHKVAFPVLCELKEDFYPYGTKGSILLVVFVRWAEYAADNSIALTPTASDSGAAVYRLRGGPYNPRRADL